MRRPEQAEALAASGIRTVQGDLVAMSVDDLATAVRRDWSHPHDRAHPDPTRNFFSIHPALFRRLNLQLDLVLEPGVSVRLLLFQPLA